MTEIIGWEGTLPPVPLANCSAEETPEPRKIITIHTDGVCSGNPGHGGYGAIISGRKKVLEISGGETETTSNRMALTAAIVALETLKKPLHVRLVSESQYVVNGASNWIVR